MKSFFIITTYIILLAPTIIFAQPLSNPPEYTELVGIPNVDPSSDFSGYIDSLYALSISIAALLAVIKIIIAGVKWMMTDVVTSKGEAKKDIQGALIGLLIVISAVLILYVINPNLTTVDLKFETPNTPTVSGVATPPPTLDTSKVSSYSIPGTGTSVSFTTSSDSTQQALFFKSCTKVVDGVTNPQVYPYSTSGGRCLKYLPTENSSIMGTNCTVQDCKTICNTPNAASGKTSGVYMADPIDKTVGYCVYKK